MQTLVLEAGGGAWGAALNPGDTHGCSAAKAFIESLGLPGACPGGRVRGPSDHPGITWGSGRAALTPGTPECRTPGGSR